MTGIGVIGVGAMGAGIVTRLLAAGERVVVLGHRNRAPIEAAVAAGAVEAASAADLAQRCGTILICVRDAEAAEATVARLSPHLTPGALVIDLGTAPPEVPQRLHAMLARQGVAFAEAPVAGGVRQAAEGTLGALVGAEPAVFDRAGPILSRFCATVAHFGPPGAAATAKLLNNFMVIGMVALIAETFSRAAAAGIDWGKLHAVAIRGAGDSAALRRIVPPAIEGDFGGYVFGIADAAKDLRYIRSLAETAGGMSDLGEAVEQVFSRAVAAGHGARRVSELIAPDLRGLFVPDRS
ncbi:MAG: NAD(P)-dependent oxidoreductase [Gemmobacter sp.]